MLTFNIVTIFPEMFKSFLNTSLIKRAIKKKLIKVNLIDIRKFTKDKHRSVDDSPFGGGPGMVLKIEPIYKALKSLGNKKGHVILLTPQGKRFEQKKAKSLSKQKIITLICGHYEGFDERIREHLIDEQISIGDYVLTGGEIPACVLIDSIGRLVKDVVGKEESIKEESFDIQGKKMLEYPQYTRPEVFKPDKKTEWEVPKILLSGDHKKVKEWRDKHTREV
ncbi:tRNA (guanosine(37)-N1)-methyltransferase TrmD [Patescibacteria group bacterium]